jgi:glycosyltransferase involved in cell wall biosynthesis
MWKLRRQHGPCLVHAHCAYPDGVGVALAAGLLGMPFVVTAHGSDLNVYSTHRAIRPQMRWSLRRAAGVIAVSRALETKAKLLAGSALTRSTSIPCAGFDPAVFFPRSRADERTALGLSVNGRLVAFVGNLVPVKGVRFLVDAWALLHQRGIVSRGDALVIIGGGVERDALQHRVVDSGVADSVRFTGPMPQSLVAHWVGAADLLCLPSLSEGMPNVVVEALACGVPVVATTVGGVPDLIDSGSNGILVPPAESCALADALEAALSRPWDREALCRSVAHLTWDCLAERNVDFLERVLQEQ